MPLQNRVDPYGAMFVSTARGTLMGNRGGALHNDRRLIVRQFKGHRWITCLLEFKGRRPLVMSPGRYTELFFLDEAVSLAAGHRPCAECRRERFNAFRDAWKRSRRLDRGTPLLAPEIDAELHRARIDSRGGKITWEGPLNMLPNGSFVEIDGSSHVVWGDDLLLWAPHGYVQKQPRPDGLIVAVLTPKPIVQCLANGYRPAIHDSAIR